MAWGPRPSLALDGLCAAPLGASVSSSAKSEPSKACSAGRTHADQGAAGREGQGAVCAPATPGSGFPGTCMDSCPSSGSTGWAAGAPPAGDGRPHPLAPPHPSQPTDPAPQKRPSIGEEGRCLGSPRKQAGWSSPDWGRPPHCRPLSQCGPPQTCPPVSTQASSGRRPRLPDPCPERCTSQGLRMSAEFQGS